ncbi:hypothetical protein [Alteromonas sp. a30]|uniref:hypothetical protein n=1 Tax=Alteromonas sp. a30 TaxID=2730917 RepID=UPI002282A8C6|nr:hypothetical protein [Alteromonas sp. a30]MCY7297520.1 hypothetical protein [Alteromonas sp. a30]
MLRLFFFLFFMSWSFFANATRNLILQPESATYQLRGGCSLSLYASAGGKTLKSILLVCPDSKFEVPRKYLVNIHNPVLSSVLVSGGSIGSENIEAPRGLELGFGAYICGASGCPKSIIISLRDVNIEPIIIHHEKP